MTRHDANDSVGLRREADAAIVPWLRSGGPATHERPVDPAAWSGLLERVRKTGLAGLVLESARRWGVGLPVETECGLAEIAGRVAAVQLNLCHELGTMVRCLDRAGVSVVLLKGAALCHTVYERPGLRPMSDLDLLVPPADLDRATTALMKLGCRRGPAPIRDDFCPRFHYEVELLTPPPRAARLDLHVRALRPLRIARIMPDEALFDGAQRIRIGDGEARIPRPEFMLIHLAAHAAYHGWDRLIWLYDAKRWTDRYGDAMDWSALVAACRRWRLSLSVAQTIRRAAALWGPVCPPDALGELESHPARWTDRWTLRQAPRDAASPLFHVLCNLCCTSGIRFRLAYVLALLRPGASHLAECYPWRHRGWTICAMVWRGVRGLGRFLAPSVRPIERRVRPSAPRRSPIHRARATLSAGAVQAGR